MSQQSKALNRRQFLAAGAVSAAAVGVPLHGHAASAFTLLDSQSSVLGLAFREGAEPRLRSTRGLEPDRQLFVDDLARVTIHGLFREDTRPDLQALWLDVAFSPGRDRVFHAWSYARGPVRAMSSASSFVVPVRTSQGLRLSVGTKLGEGAPSEVPLELGLIGEHGLRTGTYAVVLPEAGQRSASWRRTVWRGDPALATDTGVLFRDPTPSAAPVDFPYLLISVERSA